MSSFGITFDLRNPESPDTEAKAVEHLKLWARHEQVNIPANAELKIVRRDADPAVDRTFPTLHVLYVWDDAAE